MGEDIWFKDVNGKDSRKLVSWWNWATIDSFRREFSYKRNGKRFYTIFRTKFVITNHGESEAKEANIKRSKKEK